MYLNMMLVNIDVLVHTYVSVRVCLRQCEFCSFSGSQQNNRSPGGLQKRPHATHGSSSQGTVVVAGLELRCEGVGVSPEPVRV